MTGETGVDGGRVLGSLEDGSLLGQVEAARARGGYREAIELLQRARQTCDDKSLERQLVNLRIEGFGERDWPAVDWVAESDRRFEGCQGLPEIDASELDAGALRAGIIGSGGLVVRGLMQPARASEAAADIDRALRARMRFASEQPEADDERWFSRPERVAGGPVQFDRLGGEQYTDSGSLWAVDSPANACALIDFYRSIGLREILGDYFGEQAALSVRKWVLRCMPPSDDGVAGWHQDGRFIGQDIRTVNLWVALSDCGEGADAPGIELAPGNRREIYPTGTHGAVFDWVVGDELVRGVSGGRPVIRPRFRPGDAIFFDHFNLHRTAFAPGQGSRRYAVESWFFAASRAPRKQQPLLF